MSPRFAFRMSDDTAAEVREFTARLSVRQRGRRVSQGDALAAIVAVAKRYEEEVMAELAKLAETEE